MRQRPLEARRREAGFTLIELLIVIVILGVLAAVVILAVGAFNNRGQVAACKADVKAVEVAVEAYRANEGRYPDSIDDLVGAEYLREAPNTASDQGEYWISYDQGTGAVVGYLRGSTTACAGVSPTGAPTGPGGGGPGEEAPGQVTGLSVGSVTQTSASISWSAPASGGEPTSFTIEWGTNADFSGAAQATDDASPFPLSGLTAGTTYHVRVAATNGEGTGPWASTSFTTTSAQVAPSAPGSPSVGNFSCQNAPGTNNDPCTAVANWGASTGSPTPTYEWEVDNRDGFSCSSNDFQNGRVDTGTATGTSASIDNLIDNRGYCFRVRAVNSVDESQWVYASFNTPSV